MHDPIFKYSVMVASGALLSAIFFGGLWMTVQLMPRSQHPALLFLSSVLVRTGILLGGIWFCAAGDARSIIACLLGFIGVRLLVTQRLVIQNVDSQGQTPRKTQSL